MTPREEFLFKLRQDFAHIRALTPDQEDAVRASAAAGAKPDELADAYNVSRRTIYRTLARPHRPSLMARVGDYVAVFELGDEGPVQLTEWVAAA